MSRLELSRWTPWPPALRSPGIARVAVLEAPSGRRCIDLSHAPLLGHAHPAEVAAVRAALESGLPRASWRGVAARVVDRLGSFFPAAERVQLLRTPSDAREAALECVRAASGREASFLDLADLAFRVPVPPEAAEADLVAVGLRLTGGLALGALLGRAELLDGPNARPKEERLATDPLALAAAAASLEEIARAPVFDRIAAIGERLRGAFEAGCARERIAGRLSGPPGRMRISFDGQEGAAPERILEHFHIELEKQAVIAGEVIQPCAAMTADEEATAAAAIDLAVTRLRVLLVEFNSSLDGSLPWVFPGGAEGVRRRGLALYRYPRDAAAEVTAVGTSVRISFAPGSAGPVTSSGFYLPGPFTGDFTVTIRYRLDRWVPGSGGASLGLFAQNEPSTVRYYAQVSSPGAETPPAAASGLRGRYSAPLPLSNTAGLLRLARGGRRVAAWHDEGGGPILLGERDDDPGDPMIVGCKLWCQGPSGGLAAVLTDLTVEGERAA